MKGTSVGSWLLKGQGLMRQQETAFSCQVGVGVEQAHKPELGIHATKMGFKGSVTLCR
jgi:hypothetical protein